MIRFSRTPYSTAFFAIFLTTAACKTVPDATSMERAKHMLTPEVQEINFFKEVCVFNKSDATKIRGYFKSLAEKGFPVTETTATKAKKLRYMDNDYAVGTWDLTEPTTQAAKAVVVTKNGKCEWWTAEKLDKERLRTEFKDFAHATGLIFNGKDEFKPEDLPAGSGIVVDTYTIRKPDGVESKLALVSPEPPTQIKMYQLSYRAWYRH